MSRRFAWLGLVLVLGAPDVRAQEPPELPAGHPPVGPSTALEAARENREAGEQAAREQAAEQAAGEVPPLPTMPKAPEPLRIALAEPSERVAPGTIELVVVDARMAPVPGAIVDVGIMGREGRDRIPGRTDDKGVKRFEGLHTGDTQAYRVNVRYNGATFSSMPFRLPDDRGYEVVIRRLETTRDDKRVRLGRGRTLIELKDDRVHLIQQYDFVNMDETAFVFPKEGFLVRLPKDFTAIQFQDVMTDQKLARDDTGFRIFGSLPPGPTQLTWAFDVPKGGEDMTISYPVPLDPMRYEVMAEAVPGMRLDVDGMRAPQVHEGPRGDMLVTLRHRVASDPPIERVTIHLRNLPGPGPARWLALGGMLVLVALGLVLATRGGRRGGAAKVSRERRKEELLDEAAEIERTHAAGEIGPKYRQRRMHQVLDELAALLRDEAQPGSAGTDKAASDKR